MKHLTSNNLPYISVIIPAFNEEKYIVNCLESLKEQDYPDNNYEVIVSDNNSTDDTVKIAKSYGAKVVNAPTQGNTYALKKGCDSAKGDIIACTDADSIVDREWLKTVAQCFNDKKVVGITGSALVDFDNTFLSYIMQLLYSFFLRLSFFIGIPNFSGFNMAFRSDSYKKAGGININMIMSSDVDLGKRLKKLGIVKYVSDLKVQTSARRWKNGIIKTLFEYVLGYIFINLLQKNPPVKQQVIR